MPLLSYFVFVGSALIGLLYLVSAVMPHDDAPIYLSSQIEGVPIPRPPQPTTNEPASRLNPATSYAAAPVSPAVEKPQPDINAAATPDELAPPKKRKRTPRQRDWQEDYAQNSGWQGDQRWREQRRYNDGWQDRGWRNRGWRDQGWRDRGWREPFWGWR